MAAFDTGMLACILLSACRDLSRCSNVAEVRKRYAVMADHFSILAISSLRESLAREDSRASDVSIIKAMAIGLDTVRLPINSPTFLFF